MNMKIITVIYKSGYTFTSEIHNIILFQTMFRRNELWMLTDIIFSYLSQTPLDHWITRISTVGGQSLL